MTDQSGNKSPDEIDLLSYEKLDTIGIDLWSASMADLVKTPPKNQSTALNSSKWLSDLNKEDLDLLNDLASQSVPQLVDKVKDLIELAYQLGVEESNQMTRGRLLNILDDKQDS